MNLYDPLPTAFTHIDNAMVRLALYTQALFQGVSMNNPQTTSPTPQKKGRALLLDPVLNKGTAFSEEERRAYDLEGLLPPHVQTLDEQAESAWKNCTSYTRMIDQRHFMMRLYQTNRTLFYRVLTEHLDTLLPVVYNPTVATDIEDFSTNYVEPQDMCYLDARHPENMKAAIEHATADRRIDLIVVTDSEAILGIGDWGTNGGEIAIGKLMVYTAAAGVDPHHALAVVVDAGTNRDELLQDPLYLGVHEKRMDDTPYYAYMDSFVHTIEDMFPQVYLHFEDFGRSHANTLLKKYQDIYPVFNDDIEGTGIVTLAAILCGLKIKKEKLSDQVYLCFGAGSAGCGVVDRIAQEMVDQGLTREEANKHFYLMNSRGLILDDMERISEAQKPYVHPRAEFPDLPQHPTLEQVVEALHPTILTGTSTVFGAFTKDVVQTMQKYCPRPMIFPMSNPTSKAEATAKDIIEWTDGKALVATGVTSAPVVYNGTTYQIGQANNALVYPGLGLGVVASKARHVTSAMASAAAHSLNGIVDTEKPGAPVLPPISKLTEFTQDTVKAVVKEAIAEGESDVDPTKIDEAIAHVRWTPRYTK